MLTLKFPQHVTPKNMQSLAKSVDGNQDELLFKNVKLPELPPRDIDTIIKVIEAGDDKNISTLEWVSLLNNKQHWDLSFPGRARASNLLIWKVALRNHGLRYLLYWRVVLSLDNQDVDLAKGIVHLFKDFQHDLVKVDRQRTVIVGEFYQKSYDHLNHLSLSLGLPPKKALAKCGLPGKVAFSKSAIRSMGRFWAKNTDRYTLISLLNVVRRLEEDDQNLFYSEILTSVQTAFLQEHKNLVNELIELYSPNRNIIRYNKLSNAAKEVLLDLIGVMSFADFRRVIAKLTEEEVATKIRLEEWEIRQLNARVSFWSNYQTKLLSFSVFLPFSTLSLLKQLDFNVDDLSFRSLTDGTCEICALEFSEYVVVEFLRGGSSGARVINKSDFKIPLIKVSDEIIHQKDLEAIEYVLEHDHVSLWQNSCEKMLRCEFNITPNKGLRKFLITTKSQSGKPFYQDYSNASGLPSLTSDKLEKRYSDIGKYILKSHRDGRDFNSDKLYFFKHEFYHFLKASDAFYKDDREKTGYQLINLSNYNSFMDVLVRSAGYTQFVNNKCSYWKK